jgi:hypothetical protein
MPDSDNPTPAPVQAIIADEDWLALLQELPPKTDEADRAAVRAAIETAIAKYIADTERDELQRLTREKINLARERTKQAVKHAEKSLDAIDRAEELTQGEYAAARENIGLET